MKWVFLFLLFLLIPIPFWWNIQPIDVVKNFAIKGLHAFKLVPLNQEVCRNNLFAFDDVMRELGLRFWLSEGTALGCIRDSAIIPWDDDIDVGMRCEDRNKFVTVALPLLKTMGFKLTFVANNGTFFGFLRNGEKVDVDFVCPKTKCQACRTSNAKCVTCDEMIPFVQNLRSTNFLGRTFLVPGESYLEYLYGPGWKVPERKKDVMI